MLTLDQLKALPQHTIFAQGVIEDSPVGINMTNSGKLLKWVAVRGGIHDWAIYCGWDTGNTYESVKEYGDKVCSEENIKKLVPCTKEAFEMYRY